jgi:hypothetical protein
MTYSEGIETIRAVAESVIALGSALTLLITWSNRSDIREVKHATNSMKDELVAVTRSDATQKGITEGRQQAQQEGT